MWLIKWLHACFYPKEKLLAKTPSSRIYSMGPVVHKKVLETHLFENEVEVLKTLRTQPHIIQYIDIISPTTIVLEKADMDLFDWFDRSEYSMDMEHQLFGFILQFLDGLRTLYVHGIEHYDIKPENIFISRNSVLKIGDFGIAVSDGTRYQKLVGTNGFRAPEVMLCGDIDTHYIRHSMDVYSSSVMFLCMLCPVFWKKYMHRSTICEKYHFIAFLQKAVRYATIKNSFTSRFIWFFVRSCEIYPEDRLCMTDFLHEATEIFQHQKFVFSKYR